MKTLIIVILASWILYRAGVVHRFLDALIIPDLEPVPDPVKVAPAQPAPDTFAYQKYINERHQLETAAAAILSLQGKNPATVKSMHDTMLAHIINEYLETYI